MSQYDQRKYRPFRSIGLSDRQWPDRVITQAPDWCSVDLRDGNQALPEPMSVERKLELFALLVRLGFKEIEIGFPSASRTEFEFARRLIEGKLIPASVTVQVLTQARRELIEQTFLALEGAERAVVHVYNSTSSVQREQVFAASKAQITQMAVDGAQWVREFAARYPRTDWTFQYSPESFSATEPDYAVEVCNAVIATWQPQHAQRVVINLPATVEMATPNVFADQIEYFCRHVEQREQIRVSLHTHNDRGCAVAAAELGLMAGADRIEGTLFGNGERTGNMDIVTMAMNLYSQGIDPELDFSDISEVIRIYERCTAMRVHERHPWAGELVYAAFSGSHQDAIRKSIAFHQAHGRDHWDVAYLPIDPRDLGRRYEEVVRINSQSGKGGVALVLERDYGIVLPKWLHPCMSRIVQREAERIGKEVSSARVLQLFETELVAVPTGWQLVGYEITGTNDPRVVRFRVAAGSAERVRSFTGRGGSEVEALADALGRQFGVAVSMASVTESPPTSGSGATMLASVMLYVDGIPEVACALDAQRSSAVLQAALSAFGRSFGSRSALKAG
jgi:2-isopropylmalate synthase